MSGGVDSSVAAALLVGEGYDVVGVTMNVWPEQDPNAVVREDACCSLSAAEDARQVAAQLGIPHYVLNLKEVFAERVMGLFYQEYARGRTPNPCVRCNQFIKFDALWPKARALDAAYIATGHYARVEYLAAEDRYLLRQAVDARKDQSYVLYPLDQEHLARTLLPVGGYRKDEIRALAHKLGLIVAGKPESQEICFITHGHYSDGLAERFPAAMRPGRPVLARIRYKSEKMPARAYRLEGSRVRVVFERPQRAVTPGQAIVLYEDDVVLAGATITDTVPAAA